MADGQVTKVLNLLTGSYILYTLPAAQAVRAAYAQSLGDLNTWNYDTRYPLPEAHTRLGSTIYSMGDFSAIDTPQEG
jgi:hypothetical protein